MFSSAFLHTSQSRYTFRPPESFKLYFNNNAVCIFGLQVVEYMEPSQEDRQLSEPSQLPQESLTAPLSSQPTRLRRRHSAAASDVRSRLYLYEEGRVERETIRNTELAGIRAALLQLCGLMREYLDHRN